MSLPADTFLRGSFKTERNASNALQIKHDYSFSPFSIHRVLSKKNTASSFMSKRRAFPCKSMT